MKPSKEQPKDPGTPNIDQEMIKDYAEKDFLRDKLIYYDLVTKDIKDPAFCRNIIEQTRICPFKVSATPMAKMQIGEENKLTIEAVNDFLVRGDMYMTPSTKERITSDTPNITRELIMEFAKNEDLKTEEIYFELHEKKLTSH